MNRFNLLGGQSNLQGRQIPNAHPVNLLFTSLFHTHLK